MCLNLERRKKRVILCWSVLGLAVFEKSVLSSLAKWRCQKLMFVCYLFSPLPVAANLAEERLPLPFRCAWLGGFGAHDAVHVLQMLTGPNPHTAQSRGGEDNAGESVSVTVPAIA